MAYSIFQPRMVVTTDKNGVVVKKPYISPGQDGWDTDYIDRELVDHIVPVEGKENEYVNIPEIKESRRSIKETIESQADDVGLDNILRKFQMSGDKSILPSAVNATDEVIDYTRLPGDNAEYFQYIHDLYERYQAIPIELRKDMSMETFIAKVSQTDVDAYIASLQEKEKHKEGD